MNKNRLFESVQMKRRWFAALIVVCAFAVSLCVVSTNVGARVGGGHSYSSGGGSRSSGGGGSRSSGGSYNDGNYDDNGGDSLLGLFIALLVGTPVVGIPLLILIIGGFIFVMRRRDSSPGDYSSIATNTQIFDSDNEGVRMVRDSWEAIRVLTSKSDDAVLPGVFDEDEQKASGTVAAQFDELRKYDANFSETLFTDFVYALYARVEEARGRKELGYFSSYLAPDVIHRLQQMSAPNLQEIKGVIVGSSSIESVSDTSQTDINIRVMFETNYTEIYPNTATTVYSREAWTFTRKRDVLSRTPEKASAIHCPNCGGSLEKDSKGACVYCGVIVQGGEFDWFVTDIQILERENKPPLLTANVPEEGTSLPTVLQKDYNVRRQRFMAQNADFSWQQLEARIRHIFTELQTAWTSWQWERARPFETDNVFQMHRYWIEEYKRQNLRNVLSDINITQVVPAKITQDKFFDAITARIYAEMIDYTIDAGRRVLCGDARRPRAFSEYWTFIRRRGVGRNDKANANCPNCGAPLSINMAGICEYCNSKITSGEFDWVLSRIEQDEAYRG